MKIRLTQPGFEHYSGQMGVLWFEDGLSTNDVRKVDAIRMSAVMRCEMEDGSSASVSQAILDNANTSAPMFATGAHGQHDTEAGVAAEKAQVKAEATGNDKPLTSTWTREQLAVVADAKGIKGLREIADPLGLKGASIKELIEVILKAGNTVGM